MKKAIIRALTIVAGVALLVGIGSPAAQATCTPAKAFGQLDYPAGSGGYGYIDMGTGFSNGALQFGRFWQPGQKGVKDEGGGAPGSLDTTQWLTTYLGSWYIFGNLGAIGRGCPDDRMYVVVLDEIDTEPDGFSEDASILVANVAEQINLGVQYNMSPGQSAAESTQTAWPSTITAGLIPRPEVTNSTRIPGGVRLDLCFDDVASLYNDGLASPGSPYATITHYQVCSQILPYAAGPPGRSVANDNWDCGDANPNNLLVPTADPSPGDCVAVLDHDVLCDGENYLYLATQLWIAGGDATSNYETELVSGATIVECDPNIAEPEAEPRLRRKPTRRSPGRTR
jgi:hypothetical protein